MKYVKMLGLAAVAAMAFMAFAAGSASATTLEVNGTTQNSAITLTASLEPGSTATLRDTDNLTQDTCTESHVHGTTVAPFTGTSVGGPIEELSFGGCTHTTHVLKKGSLSVSHITGTTDGTVTSTGAEVTVQSTIFSISIICKTGAGVDIGTLTGKTNNEHATMDIDAVVNCGFFVPTAKWEGEYLITKPTGLGVSA
jgi:hypothetical protein